MFRVCDECFGKITDAETNSLSKFFDTRYTGYLAYNIFLHIIFSSNLVKQLSLDADRNLLCSVGEDNVIKLWRADTFFNAIRDVRWSETDGSLSIV